MSYGCWVRTTCQQMFVFLRDIKFSHSLFTLPFLWVAIELLQPFVVSFLQIILLTLTLISARVFAMGVNRFVDRHLDARSPRTSKRMLPLGKLKESYSVGFIVLAAISTVALSLTLSFRAFCLSFVLLAWLAGYSWLKRYHFLVHFYLGASLALLPIATALAIHAPLSLGLWYLASGMLFWVAGFDMLYALRDRDFDITEGLHSIPSRFGVLPTKGLSGVCFLLASISFAAVGYDMRISPVYYVGIGVLFVMLMLQVCIRHSKLKYITAINTWFGVLYLGWFLAFQKG